jgi:hypothetical protein
MGPAACMPLQISGREQARNPSYRQLGSRTKQTNQQRKKKRLLQKKVGDQFRLGLHSSFCDNLGFHFSLQLCCSLLVLDSKASK